MKVGVMTLIMGFGGLILSILLIYGSFTLDTSPIVPCYDEHGNVMIGLECENKNSGDLGLITQIILIVVAIGLFILLLIAGITLDDINYRLNKPFNMS